MKLSRRNRKIVQKNYKIQKKINSAFLVTALICTMNIVPMLAADAALSHASAESLAQVAGGDANLDGKVDLGDARAVLQACSKMIILPEQGLTAGDMDGDAKITLKDVRAILQEVASAGFDYNYNYAYDVGGGPQKVTFYNNGDIEYAIVKIYDSKDNTIQVVVSAEGYMNEFGYKIVYNQDKVSLIDVSWTNEFENKYKETKNDYAASYGVLYKDKEYMLGVCSADYEWRYDGEIATITFGLNDGVEISDLSIGMNNIWLEPYLSSAKVPQSTEEVSFASPMPVQEEEMILGDPNDDGKINLQDMALVGRMALKMYTPTEKEKLESDVTRDGKITLLDAKYIWKYCKKEINSFPDDKIEDPDTPAIPELSAYVSENRLIVTVYAEGNYDWFDFGVTYDTSKFYLDQEDIKCLTNNMNDGLILNLVDIFEKEGYVAIGQIYENLRMYSSIKNSREEMQLIQLSFQIKDEENPLDISSIGVVTDSGQKDMAAAQKACVLDMHEVGNVEPDTPADIKYGDINGDGKINLTDAQFVLKEYLEMAKLDEQAAKAADVNHDNKINLLDAQKILRFYLKIITAL